MAQKKKQNAGQSKRSQMRAEQQAAAKRQKRNRVVTIVVIILVIGLALIGVVFSQQSPKPATPPTSTDGNPTATSTGGTSTSSIFIPPNGTAEMGWIQVASTTTKPGAVVVDEHLDYQCPYCDLVDRSYGSTFRTLAQQGDIVLHVHIRSFLDSNLKNTSSTRAAVGSTCADVVGAFIAYHETVFANQPEKEGTGYTDDQLRVQFPAAAGITGNDLTTFQQCFDTQKTLPYVQAMEQVNATSTTINGASQAPPGGTPAFYVNGKQLLFSDLMTIDSSGNYVPKLDTSPAAMLTFLQNFAG
ncbi:MAG: DsbA family protein [Propionibacteriaceae bacterium]|nr:DsbA family protein [Propionibacteriaceae bacterium]